MNITIILPIIGLATVIGLGLKTAERAKKAKGLDSPSELLGDLLLNTISCEKSLAGINRATQCQSTLDKQTGPFLTLVRDTPLGEVSLGEKVGTFQKVSNGLALRASCSSKQKSLLVKLYPIDTQTDKIVANSTGKIIVGDSRKICMGSTSPTGGTKGIEYASAVRHFSDSKRKLITLSGPTSAISMVSDVKLKLYKMGQGLSHGLKCNENEGWKPVGCFFQVTKTNPDSYIIGNSCLSFEMEEQEIANLTIKCSRPKT